MPAQSQIYVAVIDDDASVCRSMTRLLQESGVHAITYPSAEDFLHDQKQPAFDCLLLDVDLASVSGLELQEHLVTAGGRTPTIFITASDSPAMRERAARLGCGAYLRKTVSAQELLRTIRSLISKGKDTEHE